jgi:uncharacterized protein YbbC (DUF1343 family)
MELNIPGVDRKGAPPRVLTGLDSLFGDAGLLSSLENKTLGLLSNQASVNRRLNSAASLFSADRGLDLRALFGPQHGARGEKQDNMVESDDYIDTRCGLTVHSLYGAQRKPTPEMLAGLDVLVVDLQDVGTRVYTFQSTLALAMQACREVGVRVVVLDRPNPVGGEVVEGPQLDPEYASFVGLYPVPLRHGLTIGELARLYNDHFGIGCALDVIAAEGWRREMLFPDTGLPWVMPSPNMPGWDTALVYPGMVLLEGTTLSEGRGTTRPFHLAGAPLVDPLKLAGKLEGEGLEGVIFRPASFEPTFQKWAGEMCGGVELHVTDPRSFRPVASAVALLAAIRDQRADRLGWREPPYEYETEEMPIDILYGSPELRRQLGDGGDWRRLAEGWRAGEESFLELRRHFLLYH